MIKLLTKNLIKNFKAKPKKLSINISSKCNATKNTPSTKETPKPKKHDFSASTESATPTYSSSIVVKPPTTPKRTPMQRKVSKEVASPPLKPANDSNKMKQKSSEEIKPLGGAKTESPDVIDYKEGQKYDSDEYEVVEVTDSSEEEEVEQTPPPAQDMNARRQAWMRARQREEKEAEEVKLPSRRWRSAYRGSTSDES